MRRIQNYKPYIWTRDDWPRFRWDSVKLLSPLAEVYKFMGELIGQMSMLGFDEKNVAELEALTKELLSSSEIEGISLNADSVRSSVARRLGMEIDPLVTDHYVEGLTDVMMDAVQNSSEPLTAERIFGWHAALFPYGRSGRYRITVADWRKGEEPMQVVSGPFGKERVHYEAPPSASVPAEMERFIDWVNTSDVDNVLKSGIAHLWFLSVHPFDDGNGRIARTIADMLLSRAAGSRNRYFSVSSEILREKSHYYEILEDTQKGDLDVTDWLLWYLRCIQSALGNSRSVIEQTLRKALYWERFREVEINERQRKVINRLWDGFEGKMTTVKWARLCKTSRDTALRDIRDLLEKGLLTVSPEGGRSTSYMLPEQS